ncbi:MAG TPA: proteasome accessory factor PafA2 family protein [Candidatus Saccharimonas sp.]|nr:proteasome accessory factor PafA2 family protein [Candidatus Saccharimonas sp.]
MRRRAMGREAEYGIVTLVGKQPHALPLSGMFPADLDCPSMFLPNGARFYIDINRHPEYATGECDNAEDVMTHALAGDEYVARATQRLLVAANRDPIDPFVECEVYANNTCGFRAGVEDTFGTHVNLQIGVPADADTASLAGFAEPLIAFLVTSQIVLGAGRLRFNRQRQPRYELAQRSGFMDQVYALDTTSHRPIVNLRDEPHSDLKFGRRLHLILFDNPLFPQHIRLTFGVLDVLCTMREEFRLAGLELDNPVSAIRTISQWPGQKVRLTNGRRLTAVEIQLHYIEQALQFLGSYPRLCPQRHIVSEYHTHLQRLQQSLEPEAHKGKLGWATKQVVLEGIRAKQPDITPDRLRAHELSMHQITGGHNSWRHRLRRYWEYDELAVKRALTEAPADTRAHARGQLIRHPRYEGADWEGVNVAGRWYYLLDPLDNAVPELYPMPERQAEPA